MLPGDVALARCGHVRTQCGHERCEAVQQRFGYSELEARSAADGK
ncbi:MAG: hypothetical protein ACLP1X_34785 [Polyangiaceae bacterium]